MIYAIGEELNAELIAKGCPFRVVFGPEKGRTSTFGRERIVIEHSTQGDTFESRHVANRNARTILTRTTAGQITIYAKSPAAGAAYFEHTQRAERVLDIVLVALYKIITKRRNGWNMRSGRFVFPEDLKDSEAPGGAVYELQFSVERGVTDVDWDGDALPTKVINSGFIQSTTEVTTAGLAEEDSETACGG